MYLSLFCAAITKCLRLDKEQNNRNLLLTVLETGKSKDKLPALDEDLLAVSSHGRGAKN